MYFKNPFYVFHPILSSQSNRIAIPNRDPPSSAVSPVFVASNTGSNRLPGAMILYLILEWKCNMLIAAEITNHKWHSPPFYNLSQVVVSAILCDQNRLGGSLKINLFRHWFHWIGRSGFRMAKSYVRIRIQIQFVQPRVSSWDKEEEVEKNTQHWQQLLRGSRELVANKMYTPPPKDAVRRQCLSTANKSSAPSVC